MTLPIQKIWIVAKDDRSVSWSNVVGLIACDPWPKWQAVNVARYGKEFAERLKKKQQLSRKLLKHVLETAWKGAVSRGPHSLRMAERGKRMATSGVDSIRKEARFVHGRNAMAAFSDCRVPKETPCISHGTLQPQTIAQHQTLTNADANICQDFITTMRRKWNTKNSLLPWSNG